MARWIETLAEFDLQIEHRAGRLHSNADALSRHSCKQCFDKQLPTVWIDECQRAEEILEPLSVRAFRLLPELTIDDIATMKPRTLRLGLRTRSLPKTPIPRRTRSALFRERVRCFCPVGQRSRCRTVYSSDGQTTDCNLLSLSSYGDASLIWPMQVLLPPTLVPLELLFSLRPITTGWVSTQTYTNGAGSAHNVHEQRELLCDLMTTCETS